MALAVSDGDLTTSLAPFSITVDQIATGSATLSWTAPTENDDGSPLTNLTGYRIYYGIAPSDYANTIDIDNAGITTYVVENLGPDKYCFAMTAVNSAGVESYYSGEIEYTVP